MLSYDETDRLRFFSFFGYRSASKLQLTFGGMWRWRRVAVARVFALVVRCRIKRLLVYSRVGKKP